jgi:uncharacterized protein YkwD/uncharacterized membrane protein required for colicin V production
MLITIIICIGLLIASFTGWYRGGMLAFLDFAGIILTSIGAFVIYPHLAQAIMHFVTLNPSIIAAGSFLAVWTLLQFAWTLASHELLGRLPMAWRRSLANHLAGVFVNMARATLLITLALAVLMAAPLSASTKRQIGDSPVSRGLLQAVGKFQGRINDFVGYADKSFNLWSLPSEDEPMQHLGFAVVSDKPDPDGEAELLTLVNIERSKRGLGILVADTTLREVGRAHSRDMFARGYFAHTDPDGKDPFDRMDAAGIRFRSAGENLALAPSVPLAHDGLMNSPKHRDNILSQDYHKIGIGIIDGGQYGLMISQEFTD